MTSLFKKEYALLIIIFLIYFQCFSYIHYDYVLMGWIMNIIGIACLFYFVFLKKKNKAEYLGRILFLMLLFPMLSIIPSVFENNQDLISSIKSFFPYLIILVYYIFHDKGVDERKIIKILLWGTLIRDGITFIEQFTYPVFLFSSRGIGEDLNGIVQDIEVRSGFYRYMLSEPLLNVICIFYCWDQYLKKHGNSMLWLLAIYLFGLWMDQCRQIMASVVLCLALSLFFSKKGKIKVVLLFLALGLVFYEYSDLLFGEMSQKTDAELKSEDNVRYLSIAYYFNDFWGGPLSRIFGNGIPLYGSSYYNDVVKAQSMGLWRVDIGVIGGYNQFGILSILIFYWFAVYVFIHRKKIDLYLQLYTYSNVFSSIFVYPFIMSSAYWYFQAILMYLIDKSIQKHEENIYIAKS